MNQDEVESQLSAMFDGELPAAECELLSRRIDRDENLRARWARYALIGAAMRSEPVATARSGFAGRVSAAIVASSRPRRLRRGSRMLWNGALAASLVVAVAGVSITMLRNAALDSGVAVLADVPSTQPVPAVAPTVSDPAELVSVAAPAPVARAARRTPAREPASYVTPSGTPAVAAGLRTELADYIVAHSAYSAPLLRRNVLSELVTGEDQAGTASSPAATGTAPATEAGGGNGRRSAAGAGH